VATKKTAPPPKPPIKKKVVPKPEAAKPPAPPTKVAADDPALFHGVVVMPGVSPEKAKRCGTLALLELSAIVDAGLNPRSVLGDIKGLAQSIKSEKLLQPLVVRPGRKVGVFEVVAGHRRLKAMQSIGYSDPVPVLIRADLIGDDDRSLACSLNENSDDVRTQLNMVEVGRAVQKLEKKKWTVARIATESGMHPQRVRRALALMDTPADVQKKVAEGKWSPHAGLEYAKLDEATREKIRSKLADVATADDIKRARKAAETETRAKALAKGATPEVKTRDGKSVGQRPVLATWRGSREKVTKLQELCAILEGAEKAEVGGSEFEQIRGAVAWALWDRGDRTQPLPPDLEPDKKDPDYSAIMRDLATFQSVVKSEAQRHTPPEPKAKPKKK
jgi:ParB/RepB/Spo0J family partition protein